MSDKEKVLIRADQLQKYFPVKRFWSGRAVHVKAVNEVSLSILEGETFGLVGESGCGKSTLGRTLIRMLEPTGGKLFFREREITHAQGKSLQESQKKMQIIFQDPYSSLNPYWTVEEILEEPLHNASLTASEKREQKEALLYKVGMHTEDLRKFPYEFSGGQRQRIGIARALMVQPEFIFCDEPIAALDVSIQAQVVNLLEDLQAEMGLTYLFAAHDLSMVRYISRRIGVMYLGSLVEISESGELYSHPLHPYTIALLSAIPVADPIKAAQQNRIQLTGEIPSPLADIPACPFAPRCPYARKICREITPELRELSAKHWVACHCVEQREFRFHG